LEQHLALPQVLLLVRRRLDFQILKLRNTSAMQQQLLGHFDLVFGLE